MARSHHHAHAFDRLSYPVIEALAGPLGQRDRTVSPVSPPLRATTAQALAASAACCPAIQAKTIDGPMVAPAPG